MHGQSKVDFRKIYLLVKNILWANYQLASILIIITCQLTSYELV